MATRRQKERKKLRYSSAKHRVNEHGSEFKPTTYRAPKEYTLFKFSQEKTYKLDVLPYAASDRNPYKEADTDLHYELTYWIHTDVGPNEKRLVCPARTMNAKGKKGKCPICDRVKEMMSEPGYDKDTVQALRPKERQMFYIIDRNDKEKGIQLFECAHFGKGQGFGEMLDNKLEAAKNNDPDSPKLDFFHLDGGSTLYVMTKPDKWNGKTFYKPTNIEIEPRKEVYDEDKIADLPLLEDMLIVPTYEELEAEFNGTSDDDDDDSPRKKKKPNAGKDDDDDEDDDDDTDKDDEDEAPKKGKGKKKPADDDDDDDDDDSDDDSDEDDDNDDDDDDDDSPPAKKKPAVEEDDDDDDDTDDDEDDDDDTDDDSEDEPLDKGDKVSFMYRKKKFVGVIKKIDQKKGLASVKCDDRDEPHNVDVEELTRVTDDDDDDDDDEDEEDKKSAKGKGGKAKKAPPAFDDDDDDDAPPPKKGRGKAKK